MTILTKLRATTIMAGAVMTASMFAVAQAPAPPPPPPPPAAETSEALEEAKEPAAAAPASPSPWSVGPIEISGYIDGYYSYNANRPSDSANGQTNDLYNFNDKTDQFSLSAAKLTFNHDPDPVGVRFDFLYGRSNSLINFNGEGNYLEQAYLSFKPVKARGLEMDFGKFVTSAGSELMEAKDDWNYSRSLLFSWAAPYFHFGFRSSVPITKTWTGGLQLVNGWNNVTKSNGGVTVGLTSSLVKPKYTWNTAVYTGPENAGTQDGYRNFVDVALLTTFSGKINFEANYDFMQNRNSSKNEGDGKLNRWQGISVGSKYQFKPKASVAARYDYFSDPQGFSTLTRQTVQEFTGTYDYRWAEGLLARLEYRRDWSDTDFFHRGDTSLVKAQSTVTAAFIAFFGPKR